jgi:protocatechuate 3,4-dioxygenase beta subunit
MHHDHEGLAADLARLLETATSRRQSLRWLLSGMAGLPLAGCGGGAGSVEDSAASSSTGSTGSTGSSGASCALIPEETGGPYPGDGTNSNGSGIANALTLSGIVRSDIRSSVAPGSATAQGIPLTIRLQLVNVGAGCAAVVGAAVYLWHCDRDGNYSMYASGLTKENYLRGVQEADANGIVTFTTIFPGCYAGRMPHVHFEVFPTLAKAASAAGRMRTSQFTFPMSTLNEVYADTGYAASSRNLASMSYATDNVFSDGTSLQMGSLSGNAGTGYSLTLVVGVSL